MWLSPIIERCATKTGVSIIGSHNIAIGMVAPLINIVQERSSDLSLFILPIVYAVVGVLVIIGAQTKKMKLIFPLLAVTFTGIVLSHPACLVDEIQDTFYDEDDDSLCFHLIWILYYIIFFVLDFYSFLVLNTFYKILIREKYSNHKIGGQVIETPSTSRSILVSPATPKYA